MRDTYKILVGEQVLEDITQRPN